MAKALVFGAVILFLAILLIGCAAMAISPVTGSLYTDVSGPVTATAHSTYSKVGTASCESILGIIAIGDASIETAAKNGEITKIHHIDYRSTNILGIYAKYTIYVYGE